MFMYTTDCCVRCASYDKVFNAIELMLSLPMYMRTRMCFTTALELATLLSF
jgi:hypothetical protein